MAAVPRLRPLDAGQKLDAAIKLAVRQFGTLTAIVLVVLVPINLVSFLITLSTLPEDFTAGGQFGPGASPDSGSDAPGDFVAGQLVVTLLSFVSFFLVPAVCLRAVAHAYLGEPVSWRDSLSHAFRRLHSILWIVLLIGVALVVVTFVDAFFIVLGAIFPLFLLVVIPAAMAPYLYIGVSWTLALPVLLLEGVKGVSALGRSHSLVAGRWWRTLGLLFLAWLLVLFVSGVVAGLLAGVTYAVGEENSVTAVGLNFLANLGGSVITTPFLATVAVVLYFDLRVRKEAFDLQVLAQEMGGRPAAEALPRREMPRVAQPAGWGAPPPAWAPPPPQAWAPPPPRAWAPPPAPPQPLWAPPAPPDPQPPSKGPAS